MIFGIEERVFSNLEDTLFRLLCGAVGGGTVSLLVIKGSFTVIVEG